VLRSKGKFNEIDLLIKTESLFTSHTPFSCALHSIVQVTALLNNRYKFRFCKLCFIYEFYTFQLTLWYVQSDSRNY